MHSANSTARCVALVVAVGSAACGYSATPVNLVLTLEHTAGGPSTTLDVAGTSDPAASRFDDGLLLSTRWSASNDGVPTVELWVDLNRASLPAGLSLDDAPRRLTLEATQVSARIAEREGDGTLRGAFDATSAEVVARALASDGQRTLSAGTFTLGWPTTTSGLYVSLTGTWESSPRPGTSTLLPEHDSQSPTPDGAPPADPLGADGAVPHHADPAGSDPSVIGFDASGCSCGTSDDGETLPDEGSNNTNTSSDSGGCDCTGDSGNGNTNTNDNTSSDSSGCDCQGDSTTDEGNTNSSESSSGSSGGCADCQGESPPPEAGASSSRVSSEPPATELVCVSPSAKAVPPRVAHRHGICRGSPMKAAFETSPIFFLFLLGWRRRRWR